VAWSRAWRWVATSAEANSRAAPAASSRAVALAALVSAALPGDLGVCLVGHDEGLGDREPQVGIGPRPHRAQAPGQERVDRVRRGRRGIALCEVRLELFGALLVFAHRRSLVWCPLPDAVRAAAL
jgi:hypothetical protein